MNFSAFFLDKLSSTNQAIGLGLKSQNPSAYGFADIIKVCEVETASNTSQTSFLPLDLLTNEVDSITDNTLITSDSNVSELSQILNQFISNPEQPIALKEVTQNLESMVVNKKQFVLTQNELQSFLSELVGKLSDASAVTSNLSDKNITGESLGANKDAVVKTFINSLKKNNTLNLSFKSSTQKLSINVSSATGKINVEIKSSEVPNVSKEPANTEIPEEKNILAPKTEDIESSSEIVNEQKLYNTEVIQVSLGNVNQEKSNIPFNFSDASIDTKVSDIAYKYEPVIGKDYSTVDQVKKETNKVFVAQKPESTSEVVSDPSVKLNETITTKFARTTNELVDNSKSIAESIANLADSDTSVEIPEEIKFYNTKISSTSNSSVDKDGASTPSSVPNGKAQSSTTVNKNVAAGITKSSEVNSEQSQFAKSTVINELNVSEIQYDVIGKTENAQGDSQNTNVVKNVDSSKSFNYSDLSVTAKSTSEKVISTQEIKPTVVYKAGIDDKNVSVSNEIEIMESSTQSAQKNDSKELTENAKSFSKSIAASREYKAANTLSEMTKLVDKTQTQKVSELTPKTTINENSDTKNSFTVNIKVVASENPVNIESSVTPENSNANLLESKTINKVETSASNLTVESKDPISQSAKEISELARMFTQVKINSKPSSLGSNSLKELNNSKHEADTILKVTDQPKSFENTIQTDFDSEQIHFSPSDKKEAEQEIESPTAKNYQIKNSSLGDISNTESAHTEKVSTHSVENIKKETAAIENDTQDIKVTAEEKNTDKQKTNATFTKLGQPVVSENVNESINTFRKVNASKTKSDSNTVAVSKVNETEEKPVIAEAQTKSSDGEDFLKQGSYERFSENLVHNVNQLKESGVEQTKSFVAAKGFDETSKTIKTSEIISEFSKFVKQIDGKQSITFQLTPENLGKVKLVVDLVQNQVNTRIEVENDQVRQFIQQNINQLKTNLQSSGIQLNNLNISLANSEQQNTKQNASSKKYTAKVTRIKEEKLETKERTKLMGYNTYEYLA